MKVFSDLIDAENKVFNGIKSIVNMSKEERDKYRNVLSDTCQLINSSLNLIILKTGTLFLSKDDPDFKNN